MENVYTYENRPPPIEGVEPIDFEKRYRRDTITLNNSAHTLTSNVANLFVKEGEIVYNGSLYKQNSTVRKMSTGEVISSTTNALCWVLFYNQE